ncbi:hypothetical protein [Streptomyces sp. E2N166]|uniref:hypothetical protein n=1 Tax=Streptomyces sp. E2N166 TaxID=1851909 RepID=UPI000EF6D96C|nr:hypothetical protein [Streptomyces sp. E2N166]
MNALGRRMSCSSPSRRPSPATHRTTRAVQRAGRLLCWTLAAGMATATTDLLLAPQAPWWHIVWPLPWYLTCLAIPAWALLRIREKASQRPPDEDTLPGSWDQAA